VEIVLFVLLGLAGAGALAGFVLLVRREIRFRRLPSDAERAPQPSKPGEAEADAWNAQVMRGGSTGGLL
jgi:hypothetical protein